MIDDVLQAFQRTILSICGIFNILYFVLHVGFHDMYIYICIGT